MPESRSWALRTNEGSQKVTDGQTGLRARHLPCLPYPSVPRRPLDVSRTCSSWKMGRCWFWSGRHQTVAIHLS